MKRRTILRYALGSLAIRAPLARATGFAPVVPGRELRFPDDEGSHPEFRTEWWYVTGWVDAGPAPLGFQITFFRTRPRPDDGNPSAFAARHLLIAHAAISDPRVGRLDRGERIARLGMGLAEAASGRMAVHIDDWHLRQEGNGYAGRIAAGTFALDLAFEPTQPPLLNGAAGYSRKGPEPRSASYYYSLPHLRATGTVTRGRTKHPVRGKAWLDHEWSSEMMDADATGWDWAGINLQDGGALMVFRMRDRGGGTRWAGGTLRRGTAPARTFGPDDIRWTPQREWRSPRTGAAYPVAVEVAVPGLRIRLVPLMDDQENDARASTRAVYWEGAVRAFEDGRETGLGYLELTGYWRPLKL